MPVVSRGAPSAGIEIEFPSGYVLREGAIVPRLPGDPQHPKDGPAKKLNVAVYPGGTFDKLSAAVLSTSKGGGRGSEARFKDDGVGVLLKMQVKGKETRLSVAATPMSMKVRFVGTRAKKVTSPGVKVKTKATSSGTEVAFDAGSGARVTVVAG